MVQKSFFTRPCADPILSAVRPLIEPEVILEDSQLQGHTILFQGHFARGVRNLVRNL
jgi:hypothetical protein